MKSINPLPNDAYWIRPGELLGGPYPGAPEVPETRAKLSEMLVRLGITHFIDLTDPLDGLSPYEETALEVAAALGRKPISRSQFIVTDCDIPTPALMREILDDLEAALDRGEVVYLHCWGGMGRTGTALACHMIESEGIDGQAALDQLAFARRLTDRERAGRHAPQTPEQFAFVRAWPALAVDLACAKDGAEQGPLPEVIRYSSQEEMRAGPRFYTEAQNQAIQEAVKNRRPLPEKPLPLD